MKMMIDPPSGWRYGFPKLWDGTEPMEYFLLKNGYPTKDVSFALNYIRMWPAEEASNDTNSQ